MMSPLALGVELYEFQKEPSISDNHVLFSLLDIYFSAMTENHKRYSTDNVSLKSISKQQE